MKKLLLAINGSSPRTETIKYALGLARRVRAKLSVLQVIRPMETSRGGHLVGSAWQRGARALEGAMVEVAFAEAGEHELALRLRRELDQAAGSLEDAAGADGPLVDYEVSVAVGEIKEEVTRYVKNHPEAVLAVYDGPDSPGQTDGPNELGPALPIPIVSLEKKENKKRGNHMNKPVLKKKSEFRKTVEKLEKYPEAVAYAEANMPDEALRLLEEMDQKPTVLLVVGRGHTFSRALKDYAVGLAGRLGYEIVAVNNKYIPKDFIPLVSNYREKLREDFAALASESARDFEALCRETGVGFRHMVKFGEATDVIKELHRELNGLDYVISEPDEDVETAPGVSPAIPVFSINIA